MIRSRVHGFLASQFREMDSAFTYIGGVNDHVHILFQQSKNHTPATIIEQVKKESSRFVKKFGKKYSQFYWQRGYAIFSVSPTHLKDVETYINNQDQHHQTVLFQDEYRAFMRRYRINIDETVLLGLMTLWQAFSLLSIFSKIPRASLRLPEAKLRSRPLVFQEVANGEQVPSGLGIQTRLTGAGA